MGERSSGYTCSVDGPHDESTGQGWRLLDEQCALAQPTAGEHKSTQIWVIWDCTRSNGSSVGIESFEGYTPSGRRGAIDESTLGNACSCSSAVCRGEQGLNSNATHESALGEVASLGLTGRVG